MTAPSLHLVVARGSRAGARVRVGDGDGEKIVGRARDADLVILDPRVSRRHLRVRACEEGVRVEVIDDASPFLLRGVTQRDAVMRAGESIVVGDSALVLAHEIESREVARDDANTTDVHLLLSGLAADVRGLAAVVDLVAALDAADDDDAIEAAIGAWGATHLHAVAARLATGAAIDPDLVAAGAEGPRVVERRAPRSSLAVLSAPAHGVQDAWVTFTCDLAPPSVNDTVRRLVAVAGRLVASTLVRVSGLRRAHEERDFFRRASVGSARSFLGESAGAREVSKLVGRLAASDVVVLLEGETGVGKTFLARILHESGPRAKAPLRTINCAAIPETLIESELFGHDRGAFTGATASRPGAFEAAGRGTVLLDEIGELPLASQAKLLRVLEEKCFERVGSNRVIPLDARVIAATNRDLAVMVEEGTFRRDLFYRIAIVKLRVPALRERGDDLVLLAMQILTDLAASAGRRVDGFSPAALDAIRRYAWPGNVRELRNAIERALVVGEGSRIDAVDLPETVHGAPAPQPGNAMLVRLPARLDVLEARAIDAALRATGGNQRRAAALLGINRVTLHRKLRAAEEVTADAGGESSSRHPNE